MSSMTKRITTTLLATAASAALLTGTAAAPGMAATAQTAQTAPAHSVAAQATGKKASTMPASPSAGCGTEQKPGNDEKTISTADGERSYRINIPRDYELETPLPLVLGFHGNGSDGAEFQNYTGLPTLPAITVFPDGDEGDGRSEERRVGKECRSRWSPYH